MPRRLLSKAFLDWADTKLDFLALARRHDALSNLSLRHGYFTGVLSVVLAEYDNQPFAQPSYPGNLDADGTARFTAQQLRKLALAYLRNHSFPYRAARHSTISANPPVPVNIAPPPNSVAALATIPVVPVTAVTTTAGNPNAAAASLNG